MHGTHATRLFRVAFFALIAVLVIFVGAGSAYAGGRDDDNGPGHQTGVSDHGQKSLQSDSQESDDDFSSDDSESGDRGKHCKKESSAGGKTGEQPPVTPPAGTTGEQGKKGEETGEAEHGKKENEQAEHGKKEEERQEVKAPTGPAPTPGGQPAPAVVTTPAPAPVTAQQAPALGGEVQGEAEQSPEQAAQGGGQAKRGGRVLAESETAAPSAPAGRLAETGFDAWQVALLGAACVAGAALLLRRVRRS